MKLDIEKEASNKDLYKYDPDEDEKTKKERHEKIGEDITNRLKALSEYTGMKYFSVDIEKLHRKALVKLLEKKGLFTEGEYLDIYYLVADEDIRLKEDSKDKIKEGLKHPVKKILLPGGLRFKNTDKTIRS